MKRFGIIVANFVFVFNILLVLLFVFYDSIELPVWLQAAGRFHPVLLHFPIALIVLLMLITLFRRRLSSSESTDGVFSFIIYLTAFFASLSAILGLFLSIEGGYDTVLINRHKMAGITISLLAYTLLLVHLYAERIKWLFPGLLGLTVICLVIGSHFGATLTHGENYLMQPLDEEADKGKRLVTDSTPIFIAAIEPILEAKCFSCHNEKKAKGDLIMTNTEKLLKGGKDGPIWKAGDPVSSHILKRLRLDIQDKKHMPPKGKTQLTPEEIQLIHSWITVGADLEKSFRDYALQDSFRVQATAFVQPDVEMDTVAYSFPAADPALIRKLNSPYRSISPLSLNSPALHVQFFIRQLFQPQMLGEIQQLKQQVVSLNATNMPVKDEDLKTISQFLNLEQLILNGTDITGSGLSYLKTCTKLQSISLANTRISFNELGSLSLLENLKKVFLWNTPVSNKEFASLEKKFTHIKWNKGFSPDSSEKLRLTPPQLVNEDYFILNSTDSIAIKHPMPGVVIVYTTDGSAPDSSKSPVYDKPIAISRLTKLKTKSVRDGWQSSNIAEFTFFLKGTKPTNTRLINQPDKDYVAQGAATLTDLKKGDIDNLKDQWLGYRNQAFSAVYYFDQPQNFGNIVLSVGNHIPAYLFPPRSIKIWGGADSSNLKMIGNFDPVQPKKYETPGVNAISIPVRSGLYQWIKIEAVPIPILPPWHEAMKQRKKEKDKKVKKEDLRGWLFVDEVFFN
jgi:Planctomycete cytochrome C/Fn3 associated